MTELSALETIDGYRRLFHDASFWRPLVRRAVEEQGLGPADPVEETTPGTYPVFFAGGRWVVKFFGRLFDGERSFAVERECARLTAGSSEIPSPRLAAWGALGGSGWHWPYLIYERAPGERIGNRLAQLAPAERLRVAGELGRVVRALHAVPLDDSTVFPNSCKPHQEFLREQARGCTVRQRSWGSLPERLVAQIDEYLLAPEELADLHRPPHLIHADLTSDHLLGVLEDGRWRATALIDFGDAMTGGLAYELAALQLDLFGGDRQMLSAFLDACGLSSTERAGLPRRALCAALLHQFNVFASLPGAASQAETLDGLACSLFGMD